MGTEAMCSTLVDSSVMTTSADSAKPSGIEIERKFLVEHPPEHLELYPSGVIEQGYLALTDDGVEVRIRRYGEQAFLTIKSGGERMRLEEEIEIDERRFRALWPLTEGRRIHKTRYLIPAAGGLRIELDVYHEQLAGLVTAEVEFQSRDAAAGFSLPAWLGREVTDDPRYKNKRLATQGLPTRQAGERQRSHRR
jgi:adenylate cyclase